MRVTAQTRAETRERILEVAQKLFAAEGFEAATTRDIAREAGLAVGTLFNYFPTKEAIIVSLAAEALARAQQGFVAEDLTAESFEETLFAFIAAGLRKLKPLRKQLPVILETSLSPLAAGRGDEGDSIRVSHLEAVVQLGAKAGVKEFPPVAMHIYWSLYSGLLLFWATDKSPRQEDTLALLDHSLEMFAGWLNGTVHRQPASTPSQPVKN